MYDIIIIGGGPAGLTAAVYARRAGKSALVLEKASFGGQITYSPKIENFPSAVSISGTELADKMMEQALSQGADIELEEAMSVEKTDNGFKVVTDFSEYEAKAVVVATGAKHRLLGVKGEDDFVGKGISFCAVCDGAFYADKEVVVVGGGNSAIVEATLLAQTCKKVTIVQNLPYLTGEKVTADALVAKDNVEVIYSATVKEFRGDDELKEVVVSLSDGSEQILTPEGVFIAIGLAPENSAFENLAELNEYGYIKADENCLTKTEGVFVAGDCRTKTVRQIATAAADGAVAALKAVEYIDALK